jgi:Cu/Ag efflux pump CusA
VARKYRRRPLAKVMEEIEDEIKEHFSEHQMKFELIQIMQDELSDLSGANRPIEVKLFGPDYGELRKLAEAVSEMLEKNGKGRGIKEVTSHVFAGNPDLLIRVDGARAGTTSASRRPSAAWPWSWPWRSCWSSSCWRSSSGRCCCPR